MECVFCKIVQGTIPAWKVAETDQFLAFLDIRPIRKGHTLVIPKSHIPHFLEGDEKTLSAFLPFAQRVAQAVIKGVSADGFHLLVNTHPAAGQEVFHLHLHIIPRFQGDGLPLWKGNPYPEGEGEKVLESIQRAWK